jgi:hypothetical protein
MTRRILPALTVGLSLLVGAGLMGVALWPPPAAGPIATHPFAAPAPLTISPVVSRDELRRQARERALALLG